MDLSSDLLGIMKPPWLIGTWLPAWLVFYDVLSKLGSFLNMVFYYAMIVEGGIDLPRKHISKNICFDTTNDSLSWCLWRYFPDSRRRGDCDESLDGWWWSVWKKFWSKYPALLQKSVSAMFLVASSECCGEPWLFRKKGNIAIHHPLEMSMALMIHTKLPYAVMRKIASYNQLCVSRFCTCFMYVFLMPYMDVHRTQRCMSCVCMFLEALDLCWSTITWSWYKTKMLLHTSQFHIKVS